MTLGRLAYSILYRGALHTNFTMDVLVTTKNGGITGDINHSRQFVSDFWSACANILNLKLKRYLCTPLKCTGRMPPIALNYDKMTEKKRSGQMTSIATIFPFIEVESDNLVSTFFCRKSGCPGSYWIRTGQKCRVNDREGGSYYKYVSPNSVRWNWRSVFQTWGPWTFNRNFRFKKVFLHLGSCSQCDAPKGMFEGQRLVLVIARKISLHISPN